MREIRKMILKCHYIFLIGAKLSYSRKNCYLNIAPFILFGEI